MLSLKPFAGLLLLALTLALLNSTLGASEPGDRCDLSTEEEDCETSTTFLKCDPTLLRCECTPNSYYESSACVLQYSEPCSVASNAQQCGVGSYCSSNICDCRAGATPTPSKKCRATLGDSCYSDVPCDDENYAQCLNQYCQCKSGMYDNGYGQCRVINIGVTCGLEKPCDETRYLDCKLGSCKCSKGHDVDSSQVCLANLGEDCSGSGRPCNTDRHTSCVSGKCSCSVGFQSNVNGRCDKICSASDECADVLEFGVCGTKGVCDCNLTMTMVDGECKANFKQSCNIPNAAPDCDDTKTLVCGADNTCGCREMESVDGSDTYCQVKVATV